MKIEKEKGSPEITIMKGRESPQVSLFDMN